MTVEDVKRELRKIFGIRSIYFDVKEHRFEVGHKPHIKITMKFAGDLLLSDHDDCGVLFRHELKGLMLSAQNVISNDLGKMIERLE